MSTVLGALDPWLPLATALGSLATGTAAIAAFWQVRLLRRQLDDARRWNRMTFAFSELKLSEAINPIQEKLNATFLKIIDRHQPLTDGEMSRLYSDEESSTRILLNGFLNELERYCAAINLGVAHEEVARRLFHYKLTRHFIELRPYIQRCRDLQNTPDIFSELEDVVTRWARPLSPTETYHKVP